MIKRKNKQEGFYVGCPVITTNGERGTVVSIDGPKKYPIIVVARRRDYDCDDVGFFSIDGKLGGCNEKYKIVKLQSHR